MNNEKEFDVVIIGAGISGAMIAKELAKQCPGISILILEAGTGNTNDFSDYEKYNNQYYTALYKTPNAPYTDPKFAPSPSVMDITQITPGEISDSGYFVQKGPFPFLSNYNRNVGGTTLHWLGTTLRMCPNDFKMKTLYDRGEDWPITYEELKPYYRRAEFEIGVSAEVEEQEILGITFEDGYVFPMHKIPQSYLDKHMSDGLNGKTITMAGVEYPLEIISTPQGRNGMPNHLYDNGTGFQPVGAVGAPDLGQRCEGNSNCVPICPVQAKYSGMKTLHDALKMEGVEIRTQSPVSHLTISADRKMIEEVHYKTYTYDENGKRAFIKSHSVKGKTVVLAANAIENAKILLASNACTTSGLVGRNLMDHFVMLTWGFFDQPIGAYRGPGSTSGMPLTRDGDFRKIHSAFRIEVGNWGWSWPMVTPESTLVNAVDSDLFGEDLIQSIRNTTSRQFRMGWEIEQLPSLNNYISIDEKYKDDLGNYRPVINYTLVPYEMRAAAEAKRYSDTVFKALDVDDKTQYNTTDPGYFEYTYRDEEGEEKTFKGTMNGAGHVVGCHKMGTEKTGSVVNTKQRAHDHENLFVVGCGSFPTIATSNPTLTMAALVYMAADEIAKDFNKRKNN